MTMILGRLVIYEGPPPTKPPDLLIMWSIYHMTNEKSYTSTSTRPMATKLDREVASDEKMLSTKSHKPLITWTYQVT